ncbi:YHS domain-containing (seleno)protein [Colwellia hornerae]|uniref:YHS domain-containing protein n=1 Tax=Colwellia hornerae TaxID=89402 RepID=A0A5C6QAV4_9GAMM|nr:YHS domain-containing (seleno)protein [Colwellia hornerae]TWX53035.1 YHS domain-containing protein [Colwellia hornerae]TWX59298.1 YHS domain-containing protein [Colwellia hornerae]TWX66184.1 YHS domain-containing protein [Colwellia hornerae]
MKFSTLIKSTLVTSAILVSSLSFAANIEVNGNDNDLAIKGYDSVSYFTKGAPTKGSNKFTSAYNGAIYQFSSADNRDLFKADPSRYAPQYGGYCAFGVTMNKKFDTDPMAWHIRGDKLYLNLNKNVQKKWVTDIPGYIETAQENWGGIKGLTVEQIEKVFD